jgi:hypothetical protein
MFLFFGTCATKNNYRRKLNSEYNVSMSYADSMKRVVKHWERSYDSVCRVNKDLRTEIENLNKDIAIYKDQNDKLHNRKINVIIKEKNNE